VVVLNDMDLIKKLFTFNPPADLLRVFLSI